MAKNGQESTNDKVTRYQLYGWILFIACALLFIAESIIKREPLLLAGSILFLLACFFFLIPLIDTFKNGKNKGKGEVDKDLS
jgi:hypothetical protein